MDKSLNWSVNALLEHAGDSLRTLKMGLCCYTCATPLESLHVFTSLKSATISVSILSRKGTTLVNLAKILPPTLKYLKIEVPFSRSYHDHQGRSGKGHQDELLAFLPDIGKEFGARRYQTLDLNKIEPQCGSNTRVKSGGRYTLHPGPGRVLQCLKSHE